MIGIYIDKGAQLTVEKIKQFIASPAGVFLYTVITGIIGIIILLAFLSMVLAPSVLPAALPVIIAFNCATGGYSLTDKSKTRQSLQKIPLGLIAVILTVAGCSALIIFCPWESIFEARRYLISGSSALIFTFFGAWIAAKSKSLNRSE
jgi:hypothetical protein